VNTRSKFNNKKARVTNKLYNVLASSGRWGSKTLRGAQWRGLGRAAELGFQPRSCRAPSRYLRIMRGKRGFDDSYYRLTIEVDSYYYRLIIECRWVFWVVCWIFWVVCWSFWVAYTSWTCILVFTTKTPKKNIDSTPQKIQTTTQPKKKNHFYGHTYTHAWAGLSIHIETQRRHGETNAEADTNETHMRHTCFKGDALAHLPTQTISLPSSLPTFLPFSLQPTLSASLPPSLPPYSLRLSFCLSRSLARSLATPLSSPSLSPSLSPCLLSSLPPSSLVCATSPPPSSYFLFRRPGDEFKPLGRLRGMQVTSENTHILTHMRYNAGDTSYVIHV